MYTSLAELITQVRIDNDDTVEPYKWADTEITRYLSEAQDTICDLINIIPDEIDVAYTADSEYVTRPAYITQVRGIYEDSNVVSLLDAAEWQRQNGSASWRAVTGTPTAVIEDMKVGQWRLYPIPVEDGTLSVSIYRRALESLADADPEVTDHVQQEAMIMFARAKSYLKQDADVFDQKQAARLELKFFDQVQAIKNAIRRKQRRPGTVVYGGIF